MHDATAKSTRELVLILVAAVDRRVLPALALAPRLAGAETRALHIAMDAEESKQLARLWMDLSLSRLHLYIEPPLGETLAESIRLVVEREARSRDRVTVLVPEFNLNHWWQRSLHRGLGRTIAWELSGIEGVTPVLLPVRVDRSHA